MLNRELKNSGIPFSVGEFLENRFQAAQARNSRLSLRAFAKLAGITHSGLSQVFTGKKKLSPPRAVEIAKRLGLSEKETDLFALLAQIDASKTDAVRAYLREKLASDFGTLDFMPMPRTELLEEWHFFAVMELASTYGSKWTPARMAKHLGIPLSKAEKILHALLHHRLLTRTSEGLKRTGHALAISDTPDTALRRYHQVSLQMLGTAIEAQPNAQKDIGTQLLSFSAEDLPEIRRIGLDYRTRLMRLSKKSPRKNRIYQMILGVYQVSVGDDQ